MSRKLPSHVFLAGSTVELISAMTCIAGLGISDAAVFVERNISFKTAAMDPLLEAGRLRFPMVRFIELEIRRFSNQSPRRIGCSSFIRRWRSVRSIQKQLDAACHSSFGTGLKAIGSQANTIYFNSLHDYVLVFLAACGNRPRIIYPHGFDQPSRLILKRDPYLHRQRSLQTVVKTLAKQKTYFGIGGLFLGIIGRVLPGISTVCLPFSGVDQVVTFRSGIDIVPNKVIKVDSLADTFQRLLQAQPWKDLLRKRNDRTRRGSLLLLLSEYNCHPIWEENRNYGLAHLLLLKLLSRATGLKHIVIKAHVRSDGSAAEHLASFLTEREPHWDIEILPLALSGLPVEAIAMTEEFATACSLGSCSLPPGLGFGIPHYVSLKAAALFDSGWQNPFWIKYVDIDKMLIDEGICRDIDMRFAEDVRALI